MPLDDKENGSNSSLEPTLDAAQLPDDQTTIVEKTEAEPSPAVSDAQPAKTIDIVRDVVGKSKERAASQADPAADGIDPKAKPPKELDDENYSDAPFSEHPRFKQLIRERNSYREDAGRYRNVETFLQNNSLSADEAAGALQIAGLAKYDPAEAFKRILPWVQELAVQAGEIVSNDLVERVKAGELTVDAAREVSRARAQAASTQNAMQFTEQQRQRQAAQSHANTLMSTASTWEADRRIKDPNYAAKAEAVEDAVAALQRREGMPTTPQGVTDMLQRAYKAVNERFRVPTQAPQRTNGQRPAVTPVRGGTVSGNTQAKPRSTLDIIRQVREATRS